MRGMQGALAGQFPQPRVAGTNRAFRRSMFGPILRWADTSSVRGIARFLTTIVDRYEGLMTHFQIAYRTSTSGGYWMHPGPIGKMALLRPGAGLKT